MKLGYTILYVADVAAAMELYAKAFGCAKRFLHESKLYGEVETGPTILGFASLQMAGLNGVEMRSGALDEPTGPMNITFVTSEVQEHYDRALAHGATAVVPPKEKPWGQVSSYVRDIDGHLVEIASPIADEHR